MNTKLYVGNLSFATTEATLRELFAKAGTVTEVHLATDKLSGRSRGFAFVTMNSPAEAQKAVISLGSQQLDGSAIKVSEARERDDSARLARAGNRRY